MDDDTSESKKLELISKWLGVEQCKLKLVDGEIICDSEVMDKNFAWKDGIVNSDYADN